MNPKFLRWLAPGCLAAMALIAATIALGSSGRDDPPARAADEFSPYVTRDGGISRPTDGAADWSPPPGVMVHCVSTIRDLEALG